MFADLPEPRNEPGGSPTPKLATPLASGRGTDLEAAEKPAEERPPTAPLSAPGPTPQPA
jgi:hypothetical protein